MATNYFQITPYSSFRFVNEDPVLDVRYNTLPFDSGIDPLNYFQKWQTNDKGQIQVLSDFTPTLRLYTCKDILQKSISFTSRAITGQSYMIYDCECDFSDVPVGVYYLRLTYNDENDTLQDLRSSPLNVDDLWFDTLLYEYTNTYNDKGVLFVNADNSLKVFNIRIEANIDEFQPLSDDIDFTDQVYDNDVLNSVPYRNFKNYIGTAVETGGIPDWLVDKMNLVFTLNKVKIDGSYFSKVQGNKFTPTRPDHGTLKNGLNVRPTLWAIDIIPNEGFFLDQINLDSTPTGDLIVIKKAKIYDNVSADFVATGLFSANSNLIRLALQNNGLNTFTLNIGLTPGGSEIASFRIPNLLTQSLDIGHPFTTVTDVYLSGFSGTNCKVTLDWNQYDAPAISSTPTSGGSAKGTVAIYEEIVPGDFVLDFNVGTGLGMRAYVGWCLCGTNGTKNRSGKYSQGWNKDETGPSTRGTAVGANSVTIAKANLPAVGLPLISAVVNPTNGDIVTTTSNIARARSSSGGTTLNYELLKGTPGVEPTLGLSAKMGAGDPLTTEPASWIDVWIIKITD